MTVITGPNDPQITDGTVGVLRNLGSPYAGTPLFPQPLRTDQIGFLDASHVGGVAYSFRGFFRDMLTVPASVVNEIYEQYVTDPAPDTTSLAALRDNDPVIEQHFGTVSILLNCGVEPANALLIRHHNASWETLVAVCLARLSTAETAAFLAENPAPEQHDLAGMRLLAGYNYGCLAAAILAITA